MACFAISCDAESKHIIFTFSVNSSSRGYHVYQSIWPNPLQDDELADVRTGSRLEMLSQGVLTTVGQIPRKISKVSSIFIYCAVVRADLHLKL